ncbi:hypothetical protein MTO96_003773 [Rhipicephalus appendiculatus]
MDAKEEMMKEENGKKGLARRRGLRRMYPAEQGPVPRYRRHPCSESGARWHRRRCVCSKRCSASALGGAAAYVVENKEPLSLAFIFFSSSSPFLTQLFARRLDEAPDPAPVLGVRRRIRRASAS